MISVTNPDWWPARQLRRSPIRSVVVCGQRLNPPVYSHVVNFPRLEIPLRGSYYNQIESGNEVQRVSVRPGSALFAAPNCWNVPEWQPGLELLTIFFGGAQVGINLISSQVGIYPDLKVRKHSLSMPLIGSVSCLLNALTELQAEGATPETFVQVVRALVHRLENLWRQPTAKPVSRPDTLIEGIRVFLQSHYQYEITRDAVAQQFNITPNHLSRLFRSHADTTFNSYLTNVRIDRAKHMLRSYGLKLDEIATRCGYHDTAYFCHVFKRLIKCTPMEYRLRSTSPGGQKQPAQPPA